VASDALRELKRPSQRIGSAEALVTFVDHHKKRKEASSWAMFNAES
jgi:hypothetical protein